MIYGHLTAKDGYQPLIARPAWKLVFDWLKGVSPSTPAGVQKLQGDDIYVNVHGYETLPPEKCRYESHRRYVDLQYCIGGSERIDWHLAETLQPDGAYDPEKDLIFYRPAPTLSTVHMTPGSFAIFFPSDAHAPKQRDGLADSVFKLVVKLDYRLIA